MPTEPVSPGCLFGKLPTHGDFVARGLTASEKTSLDDWLSAGMLAAREQLDGSFQDRFDSAPPWRFARRDAGAWLAGALVPSMDSAGRRFPVMVGRRAVPASGVESVAAACEDALYEAFQEGWTADRLMDHVRSIAIVGDHGGEPDENGWWTLGGELYPEARLAGALPAGLMLTMLTTRTAGGEETG